MYPVLQRFLVLFLLGPVIAWAQVAKEAELLDPAQPAADTAPSPQATAKETAEQEAMPADRVAEALEGAGSKLASKLESDWGVNQGVSRSIGDFVDYEILGYSLGQLMTSLTLLILTLIFRGIVTGVIFKHLHKMAGKTKTKHDEMILQALEKPVSVLLLFIGFCVAIIVLPKSEVLEEFMLNIFRGGTMLIVVWALVRVIDVAASILEEFARAKDAALLGFLPVLRKSVKVFVVIVGILMIIDNLGYNVSGILATLGIGGAAVAFASKDTIANGFGTVMIMLDRPFKVGDWIIVGDKVDGDVESIGLRSTKVRTWPKTVLSIPNGVLANEYINNWSRMPKRRIKQYVGISYDATAEDMAALVEDFKKILREDEGVQQDFILVSFTDFGESSLDILVYYFTTTIAWIPHMEIRQRINCKMMEAVRGRGLSIAFPARSLYLEGPVANKMADLPYESRWDSESRGRGGSEGRLPGDFGPNAPQ